MADNNTTICVTDQDEKFSAYYQSLTSDAKSRYSTKLLYFSGSKRLPDPYSLVDKWNTNPNTWPDLTFGDIYLYLIDTPSIFTKESMKAYKSLEAYKYVVSGHVQVVLSHQVAEDCPFVALKTKVTPSQRTRDKPHEPWVYLHKASGAVYCAHCTCMAGLGEVCSHVAALLFKVEMGVKIGMTETSSTSSACRWNSTFRKEVIPATVTEIYNQIKGRRKKHVANIQADGSTPLPPMTDIEELYAIAPNAVFFTSVTIPSIQQNILVQQQQPIESYPILLTSFYQPDLECSDKICESMYDNYTITDLQAVNLEKATRNQSVCPLWFEHRIGRVTASKAHDVYRLRESTSPDNLTRRICGYNTYNLSKKAAVRWGIQHEDECRQAYIDHQAKAHINFICEQSGLVLDSKHPFLGASPDGVISCDCCGQGTLEVKCPYKHKDITICEAAAIDKDFCLNHELHLKENHQYFTQVQIQMFLTHSNYCDFVVYTTPNPPSMVIVRVNIDLDFCHKVIQKCKTFIKNHVIRELITHKLQVEPVNTPGATDGKEQSTWCLCAEPEYGRMIQCDNQDCPYQWFHFKCVNIRRTPKGKWYCVNCEQ